MRKYTTIILLIVVFGVLLGAFFLLKDSDKKGEEDNPPVQDKIVIYDLNSDDIEKIKIENQDGTFIYKKTQQDYTQDNETKTRIVWVCDEPKGLFISSNTIESVLYNFAKLNAEKIIEEEPRDLSVYKLDDPSKATAIFKDGTEKTLLIGMQTPTKSGYYVKTTDENTVYTIGNYTAEKLIARKMDMLETFIYEESMESLNSLSLTRNGEKVFDAVVENNSLKLTYPLEWTADMEDIYPMIQALSTLSAKEYITDDMTQKSQYGLEKPKYIFEYSFGNKSYKLSLGNPLQTTTYMYAMLDGIDTIFTMDDSAYNFLDKPVEEVLDSFIFLTEIKNVDEIKVTMDGRMDVSKIKVDGENTDNDEFYFNDKKVEDAQLFRNYYQGIIGVRLEKLMLNANPELKPEITFEYKLNIEPYNVKVEFVPTEDGFSYYAFLNGQYTGLIVEKKDFDKNVLGIRPAYQALMEYLNTSN